MSTTASWICPSCGRNVSTTYCPDCGESPPHAHDLTLRGLFKQLFHAFSDIDGRLIRSFRRLVSRPGLLTMAFIRGQRMEYIGPLQLFFMANVLFFALQSLTHTNIFSSTLDSHLHAQDWSPAAQHLVANRLQVEHTTLLQYAPVFDTAVIVNAKALIILMVLPFSLLLGIFFHGARRPFVAHVMFAMHFYAYMLLVFCVSLLFSAADSFFGGSGLNSPWMDNALTLFNMAASAIYLYFATDVVYGACGLVRIGKIAILTIAVASLIPGYRFAIFLITLYST